MNWIGAPSGDETTFSQLLIRSRAVSGPVCMLGVALFFGLSSNHAKAVVAEVVKAVRTWRREAAALGIARTENREMSSAFDHDDFQKASQQLNLAKGHLLKPWISGELE